MRVHIRPWLVAAGLLAVAPALATETPDDAYFAAMAIGTAGDVSAAGEPLRAILAGRPRLVRVQRALAVVNDYELGRIDAEMAALVLDGQRFIERAEWSKADETLSAAVERNGDYFAAWHDLGRVRCERGRLRDALAAYQAALRLNPDYPYTLHNLAITYWRLGDREGSIELLQRAVTVEPSYCNAYNTLGWVFRTLGREDEARSAFLKAQNLCPEDPWPEANLAHQPPPSATPRPAGGDATTEETPVRTLVHRLRSGRAETRAAAAQVLMQRRDPEAVAGILRLLDDSRDAVRAAAARVLGAYREDRLLAPLQKAAVGDRAWIVRLEATLALGPLAREETTPPLIKILAKDPAFQVRHAAVLSLCSRDDCRVTRALQRGLEDRGVEVRGAARSCLALLGGPELPSDPAALDDWVAGRCADTPSAMQ